MNYFTQITLTFSILLLLACTSEEPTFSISKGGVEEGDFEAVAQSPTQMQSNYPMVVEPGINLPIIFKLSLNGQDNEGNFGEDHHLWIPEGITEFNAPTLRFGRRSPALAREAFQIKEPTNVHFRVDLRDILQDFEQYGFTVTPTKDTVSAQSFSGLYLAGGTAPLQWIWDHSMVSDHLKFTDIDGDSIYELTVRFEPSKGLKGTREWNLNSDISSFPHFKSPKAPLLEALTNMAIEEALLNIRADGAFSAGEEWQGIWTRDVGYASHLSLAYLFPNNVKSSLLAKLNKDNRIIQDTGTGGSWPVSVDRHIWTIAAWEYFLATGDSDWLEQIRIPIINSLKEDLLWNRDPVSGLLQGETSFEDWREQTYPPWMTAADIHKSHSLSSNILFKRALEIGLGLSTDKEILGNWGTLISRLDPAILGHFWNNDLEAPVSYTMTSPFRIAARHRDLLGESLGILFSPSFAAVDSQLVSTYPRTEIGSSVISHQLPHSPPYHNKAIWPFVESYALLAAKKAGNQAAYLHSFKGLIRSASLFLSHRENYHYLTGRPDVTAINSDRQLWSVAGWLGAIYKGLFGISLGYDFSSNGFELFLEPNNPFDHDNFQLTGLMLHGSNISITLKGSGSIVKKFVVNGQPRSHLSGLALGSGDLAIEITLEDAPEGEITLTDYILPEIPTVRWKQDTLHWESDAYRTSLLFNGKRFAELDESPIVIPDTLVGFFHLVSADSGGLQSLPTRPKYLGPAAYIMLSEQVPYYLPINDRARSIEIAFDMPKTGNYILRFIYSNGSGSVSDGNSCGLAHMKINDWWLEQMVSFPQTTSWNQWTYTGWMKAFFKKGENILTLDQDRLPFTNMNGEVNQFLLKALEIIPVQSQSALVQ